MQITFSYMAQLKQAAGVPQEQIDVDSPCTLETLVRQLADRHDDSFRRILLDASGNLQPSILFFVGDDQVHPQEPLTLHDATVVTVMSPMAGGQV